MQKFPLFASSVFLSTLAVAACSAGGPAPDTGLNETGGTGGTSTGSGATAGTGVGGSTGGTSPRGGSGGTIVVTMGGTGAGGSGGGAPLCGETMVKSVQLVPTVLMLVDNSSSMFEPRETLWDALYQALMSDTGPVKGLQSQIRFGFASYKGFLGTSEEDPACAEIESVAPALDNYAAIDTLYTDLGTQWTGNGQAWETPTGHAIGRVLGDLSALQTDPPGPKYILLVTDGNPNTCQVPNPQCGQDFTVKAVQDAYAAGVGTIPFGLGDIVAQPNDGCPHSARCGELHLQDIANAGAGLPVEAPPPELVYEQCNDKIGKMLIGAYSATSPVAENAKYFTASTPETLATELTALLSSVVSCTIDMDVIVTGNPMNSQVLLNGNPIVYGDTAGGWILEANKYQVTLQGTACTTLQIPGSEVDIKFFCDPETMEPVTEPR
jgi:hypothetical protein